LKTIQAELRDYGFGIGSIFHFKYQQIQLIFRIDENLVKNRFQADALLKNVKNIFATIKA